MAERSSGNVQPELEVDEKISTFQLRRCRDPRAAIGGQGDLIETRIGRSQPWLIN